MNYPLPTIQLSDALNLRIVKRLLEEEVPQATILKVLAVIEETAVEIEQQTAKTFQGAVVDVASFMRP